MVQRKSITNYLYIKTTLKLVVFHINNHTLISEFSFKPT